MNLLLLSILFIESLNPHFPFQDTSYVIKEIDGLKFRVSSSKPPMPSQHLKSGSPEEWCFIPLQSPDGVTDHVAIYDTPNKRMIVFGGWTGNSWDEQVYALYLNGEEEWQVLSLKGNKPPARFLCSHNAIYDSLNHRMILWGGYDKDANPLYDVWSLNLPEGGEEWTEITPTGDHPSAIANLTTIYDPVNQRMVLFGGVDSVIRYNEVWSLDLTLGNEVWTKLNPARTPPTPRSGHTAIYDPVNHSMIIFGGRDNNGYLNEVWSLDLTAGLEEWINLATTGDIPLPRRGLSAIYDPQNHTMVIFGGYFYADGFICYNDVYSLDLSTILWEQIVTFGLLPSPRCLHSAVYDSKRDQMVVFGGTPLSAGIVAPVYNDTYVLNTSSLEWSRLCPIGTSPTSRRDHTAIYDAYNYRMVVFGGVDHTLSTTVCSDAYSLDLSTLTWHEIPTIRELSPWRCMHTAIYDIHNQRMVVFGGEDTTVFGEPSNDIWCMDLTLGSEVWALLTPTGPSVPPKGDHIAIYDPVNQRMLICFGPDTANDTVYALNLTIGSEEWSCLNISGNIWSDFGATTVYDSLYHRMIVFGGYYAATDENSYALDLIYGNENWYPLNPTGTPPEHPCPFNHTAIYDVANQNMVVYGGKRYQYASDSIWILTLNSESEVWSKLLPLGVWPPGRCMHTAIYDPIGYRMIVFGGDWNGGSYRDTWILTLPNEKDTLLPTADLLRPDGSESFTIGTYDTIRWIANDETKVTRIDLFLSIDGGLTYPDTIRLWVQVDTPYIWKVPNKPSTTCKIKVKAYDSGYNSVSDESDSCFTIIETGIEETEVRGQKLEFRLFQNRPNPFHRTTVIRYTCPCPSNVSLKIYDVTGRLVTKLVDKPQKPGYYTIEWRGKDNQDRTLPSGIYFMRLCAKGTSASGGETDNYKAAKKLILLK
ncbi:hypothetical protein KAW65_08775 [candidate division WOR-3 bacterium]|nr:hypothetical protein [candidate division WOR-3 bacterium]